MTMHLIDTSTTVRGNLTTLRRRRGRQQCHWGRRRRRRGRWWRHRGRRRRRRGAGGVEGGGGAEVGQSDGAKQNFTVIRVLRQRGYSPYTRGIFSIGWIMSADTNTEIYGIGWCNLADTKNLLYQLDYISRYQQSLAYKYRPHTTVST
jgi:hypothetical protein